MNPIPEKYADSGSIESAQQAYLTKVYTWMVGGLLLTAGAAYFAYENNWDYAIATSGYLFLLIILQLGLVIALSGWINKMSLPIASATYLGYSLLTGLTFSVILRAYTSESIFSVFFIASGMFAALSFYGYVTKKDLSTIGSFMFMGLVGIIIASIVNIFLASSMLHFVISVIGVIVFAGLTAYDTQKIKEMYVLQYESQEIASKGAIIGALKLYLDFINLFLFLLRLFGSRR